MKVLVEHYTTYKNCSFLIAYPGIDFDTLWQSAVSVDQKNVNPSMVIKLMVTNPPKKVNN